MVDTVYLVEINGKRFAVDFEITQLLNDKEKAIEKLTKNVEDLKEELSDLTYGYEVLESGESQYLDTIDDLKEEINSLKQE